MANNTSAWSQTSEYLANLATIAMVDAIWRDITGDWYLYHGNGD